MVGVWPALTSATALFTSSETHGIETSGFPEYTSLVHLNGKPSGTGGLGPSGALEGGGTACHEL